MKYEKPALTVKQQIDLLKNRNLIIDDENEAILTLSNISYYRLSSYLYPYRNHDDANQSFYDGTSLNHVLKVYSFDRKLRLLLYDAIERFEIAFRTQFILQMSLKYDPFWYLNSELFYNKDKFKNIIDYFKNEYKQNNEVFIEHYKTKYTEPILPPAWMSLEVFTFGHVSHHFSNLKRFSDKKMIAKYFNIEYPVLESWLHSITYIRNICAHHARLWNRSLRIKPQYPKSNKNKFEIFSNISNDKIYVLIVILKYLLDIVHPKNTFKNKLQILFEEYPYINIDKMGFIKDWQNDDLWKGNKNAK
jgi:abortive infection bacteriophage resistance protein